MDRRESFKGAHRLVAACRDAFIAIFHDGLPRIRATNGVEFAADARGDLRFVDPNLTGSRLGETSLPVFSATRGWRAAVADQAGLAVRYAHLRAGTTEACKRVRAAFADPTFARAALAESNAFAMLAISSGNVTPVREALERTPNLLQHIYASTDEFTRFPIQDLLRGMANDLAMRPDIEGLQYVPEELRNSIWDLETTAILTNPANIKHVDAGRMSRTIHIALKRDLGALVNLRAADVTPAVAQAIAKATTVDGGEHKAYLSREVRALVNQTVGPEIAPEAHVVERASFG